MPFDRQTSFAGGEIAPMLWGRTDLAKRAAALRACRNFFVAKEGALLSRPGTTFVDWANNAAGSKRLIPFLYTDSQSYVLEVGAGYVWVYSNGAKVATGAIVNPYASGDIAGLRFAQLGDVMYFTHPSHGPRTLTRNSHTSWTFAATATDFSRPALTNATPKLDATTIYVSDATHPYREWTHWVTELRRDARGVVYESKPFQVTIDTTGTTVPVRLVIYPDKPAKIQLTLSVSAATLNADPYFIGYRVYRGRGGLVGWIGDTKTDDFTDVGQEPDYTIPPPQGRNPFQVLSSTGTVTDTQRPTALAFFQERLWFAGLFGATTQRPGWFLGSTVGDYLNFDERLVNVDDMAVGYELGARRREEIRHLLPLGRLLALTGSSVWSIGGSGGDALTATTRPDVRVIDEVGADIVTPLVVDETALFVRTKGVGVRGIAASPEGGNVSGVDLSAAARHLFTGAIAGWALQPDPYKIVDWTYAADPWGLVWAVRQDGSFLSLTFSRRDEIYAWARHDTDGVVWSICTVPETNEDAVYMLVNREGPFGYTLRVERMGTRLQRSGDLDSEICLDGATRWVGTPALTITITDGYSKYGGKQVYVTAKNNAPQGPYSVNVSNQITLGTVPTANSGANVVLYVGLKYTPELETLDLAHADASMRQKTVVAVGVEVVESKGLQAGPDLNHLTDWNPNAVTGGYTPTAPATQLVKVPVKAGWGSSSRIAVRQALPLPLTVVGLVRELSFGE